MTESAIQMRKKLHDWAMRNRAMVFWYVCGQRRFVMLCIVFHRKGECLNLGGICLN